MIIIRIMSGLGNQMFQYALARKLVSFFDCEVKLDVSYYQKSEIYRNYELNNFQIQIPEASNEEIEKLRTNIHQNKWKDMITPYYRRNYILEKSLKYDKNIFKIKPPIYLEGYWQSEKYFADIRTQLSQDFSPQTPLNAENQALSHQIREASHAVCVHFRRGDYVHHPIISRRLKTLDQDYYQKALDYLQLYLPNPTLFIFSDEIDWVKKNVHFDLKHQFIDINSPITGFYDLQLMRQCQHHIIANSTLSWWAAWLNTNPQKIVIAPKKWFLTKELSERNIVPIDWVKI